ncbi:MAG TPA: glycosyltransferase family 9 protein [Gemmatimonadaceae bacterium]|nr:glycosyltransferase family 9 protein [Gemmatimonadaceae bacterium]
MIIQDGSRVCIVMLSSVGGATWTLPVLNAIKRHAPLSHITWIMQPGPASLVRGHPAVDDIVVLERKQGWRAFRDVRDVLRSRRFDVSLTLQVYLKAGIVTSFVQAPIKVGYDRARTKDASWLFTNRRIPPRPRGHIQDEFLEFLAPIGVDPGPVEYAIGPCGEERAAQQRFYDSLDRPAAVIVVGTTNPEKDWPADRWATVAEALRHDFGLEPVLAGGRSDRELAAEHIMRTRMSFAPRSTLGCPLRELVGIIDGAALVLSPDTGPLHLSVALERPVIGLYGYLDPRRVGPYRRYQDLLIDVHRNAPDEPVTTEQRRGRMERISVRDVLDRVERWRTTYASSRGPKA